MPTHRLLALAALLLTLTPTLAQDRDTKVRNDRKAYQASPEWIYNDLPRGFDEAKRTGKPLLIVFRCIPCEACAKFDDEVARRHPLVKELLDQFVCVRVVQANALDLELFQYDYDQSWSTMFLNADKTIYGRFGTRSSHKDAEKNITTESFRAALAAVLELHKDYPANRAALQGKRGRAGEFKTPLEFPSVKGRYTAKLDYEGSVARSCLHCHQVGEAQRQVYRSAGKPIPEEVLYPYPMPDLLGLKLDPNTATRVLEVAPDSVASRGGFQAGDELLTLAGQPLVSLADVQWVLHTTKAPAVVEGEVRRGGAKVRVTLDLPAGWRQRGDLSWRPTTWELRRMALGGLWLEELDEAGREKAGLGEGQMGLHVRHVGQYGAHAFAKNAGVQQGDILVSFDGRSERMTETELLAHGVTQRRPGDKVPLTVLRGGKRIELTLPLQ